MRTLIRTTLLTVILGAVLLVGEAVSIVVAPAAVYIDHGTRSAEITLFNPSNQAEEVEIEALFGYPATDENGRLHLHLADPDDDRSAAGWLRAFPRRVIVPPGGRQIVRLLGEPPADLPDGEYWARLAFTSRPQQSATGGGGSEVQVGLSVEVRTVISATYRKGSVTTGVRIESPAAWYEDGRMVLRPRFVREGNGAYIGELAVRLYDDGDGLVREWTEQVAVYREYHRRLAYDIGDVPPGVYRVHLYLTTDRDDIPPAHRLLSAPVAATVSFRRP